MMAVDGYPVLDAIHDLAFTMTGGVGNTWPGDSSNWNVLLGGYAPVIAQATDNLLSNENASFEGNTVGEWGGLLRCTLGADATQGWHGTHSLKMICNANGVMLTAVDVTAATSINTQYAVSARFKGVVGKAYVVGMIDSTYRWGTPVTADGTWQVATATITVDANATRSVILTGNAAVSGNIVYWDAIQLETGAVATPFALDSRTACTMTIPTATIGLTAGMPLTIMFVINVPWAGNDGASYLLFDCDTTTNNRICIIKDAVNNLTVSVTTTAGAVKYKSLAVNAANMAANTNHVIIATLAADNTQQIFLDGTAGTTSSGASGRETALSTDVYLGTVGAAGPGTYPINGAILAALWGRVLTAGELATIEAARVAGTLLWANIIDLPQITVTGLAAGNAARLYDSAGNVHASAVEAGGTATLTYTLD